MMPLFGDFRRDTEEDRNRDQWIEDYGNGTLPEPLSDQRQMILAKRTAVLSKRCGPPGRAP